MALAAQAKTGKGIEWRQWAKRVTDALSACWQRVAGWFSPTRTPAELRSAERQRRKQIKRQLKQRD